MEYGAITYKLGSYGCLRHFHLCYGGYFIIGMIIL